LTAFKVKRKSADRSSSAAIMVYVSLFDTRFLRLR